MLCSVRLGSVLRQSSTPVYMASSSTETCRLLPSPIPSSIYAPAPLPSASSLSRSPVHERSRSSSGDRRTSSSGRSSTTDDSQTPLNLSKTRISIKQETPPEDHLHQQRRVSHEHSAATMCSNSNAAHQPLSPPAHTRRKTEKRRNPSPLLLMERRHVDLDPAGSSSSQIPIQFADPRFFPVHQSSYNLLSPVVPMYQPGTRLQSIAPRMNEVGFSTILCAGFLAEFADHNAINFNYYLNCINK